MLLCTHHLRGLTEVEEGVNFWEEGVNFLHGVFPYIHKESLILYPRISTGVLAVSDFGHSM